MQEILEYQKLDRELFELENKVNKSNAKKQKNDAVNAGKTSQEELKNIVSFAGSVGANYEGNLKTYARLTKETQKLTDSDTSKLNAEEIAALNKKIEQFQAEIEVFQRVISQNNNDALKITKGYEDAKNKIRDAQLKIKQADSELIKLQEAIKPQKEEILARLNALEKSINKEVLTKYKLKRADNIFPVFVPLRGSSCGGCGVDISALSTSKIKGQGYITCENCKRFIYE